MTSESTREIEKSSKRPMAPWIAAGVLLLVAAGAGVYAANLRIQLEDVELRLVDAVTKLQDSQERLVGAATELGAIRSNIGLLSAANTMELKLTGRGATAQATGRAFVSSGHGLLISVSGMSPLPADRAYQVWLLGKGTPVNAGTLRPDQQGNATAAFDLPADAPSPVAGMQLTAEPAEGSATPTGGVVLASN